MTKEHRYELESKWVKDKIVTIEIEGKEKLEIATPPDFWDESPEGMISPEDLFLASVVSCYGVTLPGVAKRFHAEFIDFRVTANGTLARGEFGWEFDQISMFARIRVSTETDKKRMKKAAERAHKYCLIGNSVKCPVHLEYEITLS
ncbi:MAG: OsmC family protein [Candidatus Thorarchaeota archaeon]|nr:MAG: OsmC family protein [Candidatus Thorarchaeota archaeon]